MDTTNGLPTPKYQIGDVIEYNLPEIDTGPFFGKIYAIVFRKENASEGFEICYETGGDELEYPLPEQDIINVYQVKSS